MFPCNETLTKETTEDSALLTSLGRGGGGVRSTVSLCFTDGPSFFKKYIYVCVGVFI